MIWHVSIMIAYCIDTPIDQNSVIAIIKLFGYSSGSIAYIVPPIIVGVINKSIVNIDKLYLFNICYIL